LDDQVIGGERESFTSKLKAPQMWSIGRWDRLIASLPVRLVERRDWALNTALTFQKVLANFKQVRQEFTARLGQQTMDAAFERLTMQHEFARAGKLGWCFMRSCAEGRSSVRAAPCAEAG